MKVLVAITCVAVLAAIGYFGWSEYGRGQQAQRIAEYRASRQTCLTLLDTYVAKRDAAVQRYLETECIDRTLINAADIERAKR